ncbi:MAG: glucose-1-phosphate cytidylyltransferase [Candidatus Omnitrophica bacterium]|nr:glucose-1-phosphate cytidylyltransferase [Candidatus Omnitrophota bacterium]MBM3253551.1 glucose-1-phosphate cytidylyltransferase [Candidatus Omnitrophota bacterium]
MKVVILAGGRGTRISEETEIKPKPMVEIGGKPILWHIMKIYSHYGFNDFIVCLGYLGYMIKEYYSHYFLHMSDVTIDMKSNETIIHNTASEPWKITLVDTGFDTMTGGRLKRIEKYIGKETFMLTYGDGLSDINIKELLKFHKKHKKLATLTAIQAAGRFGVLGLSDKDIVRDFLEKPKDEGSWINGGFFVLEPKVLDYIKSGDATVWEKEPLQNLGRDNQLVACKHTGFWDYMDTLRDKIRLEQLWQSGKAPWKAWR